MLYVIAIMYNICRLVYTASSWYVGHLQVSNISGVPIVIVSAHPEVTSWNFLWY